MIERAWGLVGDWKAGVRWPRFGGLEWVFLVIIAVAAGMRLWELNGRTMHYDEAIHLHFAWKLAQGVEFVHSPWMHGPLQIELVAAFIRFIGDTDFLARLPYALFGVALVAMPYFLREQLGSKGAVCAAIILAMSPTLLYFSRFGRNDILMVVWALLLLILLWRYTATSRSRYLYWSAPVVALMLASKETAYFIILFFGVAALALGFRELWAFLMRRRSWSDINGAGGFFILLATLTLPQAAAMLAVIQGPLGLTLAAKDSGSTGETGAPAWAEPFVTLPVWESPLWLGILAAAALAGVMAGLAWWQWRGPTRVSGLILAGAVAAAVAAASAAVAVAVATVQPLGDLATILFPDADLAGAGVVDFAAAAVLALLAVVILRLDGMSVRRITLVLGPAVLLTLLWLFLLTPNMMLSGGALPNSAAAATADLEAGRIAVNYLVPVLALLALFAVSVAVGVSWGGGVWLIAAGIFYAVWTALYTTLFTNAAGLFTGSWQSLGYWLAQQEEARGNQPWYYYGVGLTVYELLALAFGLAAVVWLIRRREPFGLALAGWTIATLAVYTTAGEKMPWLLVNITVPLALAAGMLLGHLADGVWSMRPAGVRLGGRHAWLLILAPAWLVVAVWVGWLATGEVGVNIAAWLAALILLPGAALICWLMRAQPNGGKVAALGVATLLLAFGTVSAIRAAYTYDDSNLEVLVYAQGSYDLTETYRELGSSALASPPTPPSVKVDYDMWYPFQWYVRAETQNGILQFDTFCASDSDASDADDDDKDDSKDEPKECRQVGADPVPQVYLAESGHAVSGEVEETWAKSGPMRNLLWYPETYRRPNESRTDTSFWQQLSADVSFFTATAAEPAKWRQALGYIVARHQGSDWYKAEYYQYTRDWW